jgi:hypothetical protein
MAEMHPDVGSNTDPPDWHGSLEHQTLLQQIKAAGYLVVGTRPNGNCQAWTLAPEHSQLEFQLISTDELRRFLHHHRLNDAWGQKHR